MTDILTRIEDRAGRITLNRPQALNALTDDMLREIGRALGRWRDDPAVDLILIDAAGDKAFAAGGDIVDLYRTGRAGDFAFGRKFWAEEYRLNAAIARCPKPWVAVMTGFVMGGGVGVSAHGSHRVVTENSRVAMPECGIGLTPDVGGSLLLARAPGRLGEYLGITSARMGPGDAIHAGFADTYVPPENLEAMKVRLSETGNPDVVAEFAAPAPPAPMAARQADIDAAFSRETALEIVAALEKIDSSPDWAREALEAIRRNCPLSVACTLQLVRDARVSGGDADAIEQALTREYRFIWRCMEEGEFLEGIRAAVIDKDRNPQWARPSLEDIDSEDINRMLAPVPGGDLKFHKGDDS